MCELERGQRENSVRGQREWGVERGEEGYKE